MEDKQQNMVMMRVELERAKGELAAVLQGPGNQKGEGAGDAEQVTLLYVSFHNSLSRRRHYSSSVDSLSRTRPRHKRHVV